MATRRVNAIAVLDFMYERVRAIEVTVIWGGQRGEMLLIDPKPENSIELTGEGADPRTVQYQYRAYCAERVLGGQRTSFESALLTTEATNIVIDPRELYRLIEVTAVAVFDLERYRSAFVDLRVTGPKNTWTDTHSVALKGEASEARLRFMAEKDTTVLLERRVRYVTRAGDVIETPWQPLEEGTLVVGNPMGAGPAAAHQ